MAGKCKEMWEGLRGASIMTFSLITPFLNDRRRIWGATEDEVGKAWPGDDFVPQPKGEYMHAITIKAPAAAVWPWLVQIGQGRGGFYSYEFLENMIGCKMRNADRIIPELQNLKVGDNIPMHPTMGNPYRVASIEPGRVLILSIRVDATTGKVFEPGEKMPEKYQNMSWLFFLDESDGGTTRLISRSRNDWNQSLGNTIFFGIFGPLTLEMDRKMLKGIKQHAEAANKSD